MEYIEITDSVGRMCVLDGEPACGSVVLTHGLTGTAWQRQFKDGRWHRAGGGRSLTWSDLLMRRNLILVHEADPS